MGEDRGPLAERMTWAGYEPPGDRLLAWDWAVERLTRSRRYWLATRGPGGTPHVMPVWGAWVGDAIVFSTGRHTRKARNIGANPGCVITTEHADEAVVVEGVAGELTDPTDIERADGAYRGKYGSSVVLGDSPVFAVRPTTAFAIVESGTETLPTRWRFPPPTGSPG